MSVTYMTIRTGPPTLNEDNSVQLKSKNDISNSPHRLTTVETNSVEGQLLAMWKPNWNIHQLAVYLKKNPEICGPLEKDFKSSIGAVFCNPKGVYPSNPEHVHMGNGEWKRIMHDIYPTADIEDRKMQNWVFCFWRTGDKYYVQWELAFLLPQVFSLAKQI